MEAGDGHYLSCATESRNPVEADIEPHQTTLPYLHIHDLEEPDGLPVAAKLCRQQMGISRHGLLIGVEPHDFTGRIEMDGVQGP